MGHSAPPRFPYPIYRRGAAMKNQCHAPDIDSKKTKRINNTHIYNHDEQ